MPSLPAPSGLSALRAGHSSLSWPIHSPQHSSSRCVLSCSTDFSSASTSPSDVKAKVVKVVDEQYTLRQTYLSGNQVQIVQLKRRPCATPCAI